MKPVVATAVLALLIASAGSTFAQSPASKPGEIADAWLLLSKGRVICELKLSGRARKGGPYAVEIPADCKDAFPADTAGWKPTPDGIALVAADGSATITFERWSESLFVSTGTGAPDLQLSRAPIAHPRR